MISLVKFILRNFLRFLLFFKLAEEERKQDAYCQLCKKQFSTEKAFQNHEQSKKHREAVTKSTEDMVEKKNQKNLAMSATAAKADKSRTNTEVMSRNLANLKITNKESLAAEKGQKMVAKKLTEPKPSTSSKQNGNKLFHYIII